MIKWTPEAVLRLYQLRMVQRLSRSTTVERLCHPVRSIIHMEEIMGWHPARPPSRSTAETQVREYFSFEGRQKRKLAKAQAELKNELSLAKAEPAPPYKPGPLEWK